MPIPTTAPGLDRRRSRRNESVGLSLALWSHGASKNAGDAGDGVCFAGLFAGCGAIRLMALFVFGATARRLAMLLVLCMAPSAWADADVGFLAMFAKVEVSIRPHKRLPMKSCESYYVNRNSLKPKNLR